MIRPARVQDALAIAQVHVASWQSAYKGLIPQSYLESLSVAQREDMWINAITNSPTLVTVCEDEGKVVGFVAFGRSRDEDAQAAQFGEIYAIYLKAEAWGQGHGKALLDSAIETLQNEGYQGALLWVLDSNQRAIQFYERNGLVADGATKTDELTAGVMVTELRYIRSFTITV